MDELHKRVATYTVSIHVAGDIADAKRALRRHVYPPNKGLCVTIQPETFIYTGGEEEGFVVGLVNYPRFPSKPKEIWERAEVIARLLLDECCQMSALLVAPDKSEWITRRTEEIALHGHKKTAEWRGCTCPGGDSCGGFLCRN